MDKVSNLISQIIRICLFKAGPADVPASQVLMNGSLLVYVVISVLIGRTDSSWEISLLTGLAEMLVMMIMLWVILSFRKFQVRYQQTLIAMAGTGVFLGVIGLPVLIWFYQLPEADQPTSFPMLLVIALLFWSLMVTAHIFRQALEIRPSVAVMITVAYTIISLLAVGLAMSVAV